MVNSTNQEAALVCMLLFVAVVRTLRSEGFAMNVRFLGGGVRECSLAFCVMSHEIQLADHEHACVSTVRARDSAVKH